MIRSRLLLGMVAVLVLGVQLPDSAWAVVKCLDDVGDAAQIVAARSAIDATCKCFGVAGHGEYVGCAAGIVDARADALLLRSECTRTVKKIYRQSVCGKQRRQAGDKGPAVPCITRNTSTGTIKCALPAVYSPACQDNPERDLVRNPCTSHTHCLDAADTNGDLKVDSADSGSCTANSSTFTDNGDGTITDNKTGLMWEKNSDDGGINDADSNRYVPGYAYSVTNALNSGSGFAGHTDWRIPTIHELMTLIRGPSSPTVPPEFNTGCVPGCTVLTCSCTETFFGRYTSSTNSGTYFTWTVNFVYAAPDKHEKLKDPIYVRAVRGPVP